MKIACITTSVIPSNTANSIQAMKVCHALKELDNEVQLWIPGIPQGRLAGTGGYLRIEKRISRSLAALPALFQAI